MPFPMNMPGAGGIGPEMLMQLMELLRKKRDPSSAVRPGEMGGAPPMDPSSAVRPGEMGPGGPDPLAEDEGMMGAPGGGQDMPPELLQLMARLGVG